MPPSPASGLPGSDLPLTDLPPTDLPERFLVRVGARLVHGVRVGQGPVVVALHGSPESAGALAPVMRALASQFTVIGLDTPGNGDSDPLTIETPSTDDYAAALLETLDALGLGRVGLYGFHTGAGIASQAALRAPDRICALVLDGCAIWTPDERKLFLSPEYLTAFTPTWDGAHLATLWSRIEEQSIFFPYYLHTDAARLPMDVPDRVLLQRRALDWLKAGDAYRGPYAAAFRRDGGRSLEQMRVPTLLGATPPDPLVAHLDRAGAASEAVSVMRWRDKAEAHAAMARFFSLHPGDPPPHLPFAEPDEHSFAGGLHVRRHGGGDARPLVVLHEAGASRRRWRALQDKVSSKRLCLAIDLPGHGLSDHLDLTPDAWRLVVDALDALGSDQPLIAGAGLGGRIALDLVAQGRGNGAVLLGAPTTHTEQAHAAVAAGPDLTPAWHGGHLSAAWRYLRRRALFDPWYEPTQAAAISSAAFPSIDDLHTRCVDLLRAAPVWPQALRLENTPFIPNELAIDRDALHVICAPGLPDSHPDRVNTFVQSAGVACTHAANLDQVSELLAHWRS